MLYTTDFYLGIFLIICGFAISLFNLKRLMKRRNSLLSVLISENLVLICIGIAFLGRSIHKFNTMNINGDEAQKQSHSVTFRNEKVICNFKMLLASYGPFIISLVNSFISLVIDSYMVYKVFDAEKKKQDNIISTERRIKFVYGIWKKYSTYILIVLQWFVPIITVLSMYLIDLKMKLVPMNDFRSLHESCMAMIDATNNTCTSNIYESLEGLDILQSTNLINITENTQFNNSTALQINNVIRNVFNIIDNYKKESNYSHTDLTDIPSNRTPKTNDLCMEICYIDNKNLVLYMFLIIITSYFIPITISAVILTKRHGQEFKKSNLKTQMNREFLLNILFWSPPTFDMFLSLLLCAYTTNGVRTSIFNVIANVYQIVRNFTNTKYLGENTVLPV